MISTLYRTVFKSLPGIGLAAATLFNVGTAQAQTLNLLNFFKSGSDSNVSSANTGQAQYKVASNNIPGRDVNYYVASTGNDTNQSVPSAITATAPSSEKALQTNAPEASQVLTRAKKFIQANRARQQAYGQLLRWAQNGSAQATKDLAVHMKWDEKQAELALDLLRIAAEKGNKQAIRDLAKQGISVESAKLRGAIPASSAAASQPVRTASLTPVAAPMPISPAAATQPAQPSANSARQPARLAATGAPLLLNPAATTPARPRPVTISQDQPGKTAGVYCYGFQGNKAPKGCGTRSEMIQAGDHILVRVWNSRVMAQYQEFKATYQSEAATKTTAFAQAVVNSNPGFKAAARRLAMR